MKPKDFEIGDVAILIPIIGLKNGWKDREEKRITIQELNKNSVIDDNWIEYSLTEYAMR